MPPLKTPAAFHERIRSLERARTGTFLKHKLCSRPERSELVRMHILQETQADSSLQATQLRLKRARLADSLNEKISQRPGPMELVEKNILPVQPEEKDSGNGDELPSIKTPDVYSFDEDSSDGSSPGSQKSDISSSSRESGDKEMTPLNPFDSHKQKSSPSPRSTLEAADSNEKPPLINALVHNATPAPVLVKQSLSRTSGERSRSKKSREQKPRVKKLKYHQYIPPHQKQEQDVPMDSTYARILQQQQQFLQLQILSQQQYNYQTVPPAALNPTSEVQNSGCSGNSASLNPTSHRTELPTNLEEMKVAELKTELKLRSLPVSGTKTDLIERLRSYHENPSPPVSPIATKVSKLGLKDTVPSDAQDSSTQSPEKDLDKDKRLFEKERQIEELMRKLEQEQRLVEELKMQLEEEKRSQQGDSPPPSSCPALLQVKEESVTPPNCSGMSNMSPVPPRGVKEEVTQMNITHPTLFSMNLHNQRTSEGLMQPPGPNTKATTEAWTDAAPLVLSTFPTCVSSNRTSADTTSCPGESSLIPLQHKSKDPPRYEEAVKQTRGMITQCPSVSSQQMDDLFDVLIETGEILPFIKPEPRSLEQRLPVTASVTTLPINTVLCRPPAVVHMAQLPVPSAQAPVLKPTEEQHAPLPSVHMDFEESTSDSHLHNEDSMDWLDLTDMTAQVGIFSSDFLDSNEMHLNWE